MQYHYRYRQLWDVARAFLLYRRLLTHDRWSPRQLARFQRRKFQRLLRHAVRHSPFYRELYAGISIHEDTALEALPVITKQVMMRNFDRLVTDRRLNLHSLETHLGRLRGDEYFLREYRVLATSGTTGLRGVFVYNRKEWRTVLANALRWYGFIGVHPRFPNRVRITSIGADSPVHVSVRMVESGNVGLFAFQRLEVTASLENLVQALNDFQPEVLLPYPSIAALLAIEQIEGRLNIHPRVISTHTEALTAPMARTIRRAWGISPFNHYGLTELPTFGSECSLHRGIHAFEDLFIAEIVDESNNAVQRGHSGKKLLLTNLYNFTQPLIRYEVSDLLTAGAEPCACGRPFPLIAEVGGRKEEEIVLKSAEGRSVSVPPLLFSTVLDSFHEIAEFDTVHNQGGIRIRVVLRKDAASRELADKLIGAVASALKSLGAEPPPIEVDFVAQLRRDRSAMGKIKLVGAADC
jgi:phenylacetate-coenzyme A ligase PaaK-like adenylate-forming protein